MPGGRATAVVRPACLPTVHYFIGGDDVLVLGCLLLLLHSNGWVGHKRAEELRASWGGNGQCAGPPSAAVRASLGTLGAAQEPPPRVQLFRLLGVETIRRPPLALCAPYTSLHAQRGPTLSSSQHPAPVGTRDTSFSSDPRHGGARARGGHRRSVIRLPCQTSTEYACREFWLDGWLARLQPEDVRHTPANQKNSTLPCDPRG